MNIKITTKWCKKMTKINKKEKKNRGWITAKTRERAQYCRFGVKSIFTKIAFYLLQFINCIFAVLRMQTKLFDYL